MRALFGVVSLLIALAIVGFVVVKQLGAVGHVGASSSNAAAAAGIASAPAMSGSGNVREQAVQLENKVKNDLVKALEQGASARKDEADK